MKTKSRRRNHVCTSRAATSNLSNAGGDASVVLNEVKSRSGNEGFNAANDQYGDMLSFGIIYPSKVSRTALQ